MATDDRRSPHACIHGCDSYRQAMRRPGRGFTRRGLLGGLGALSLPALFPRVVFGLPAEGGQRDILICIFLRGGADGLNMVVPYGDSWYYQHRPGLAIQPPGAGANRALDLDGFYGLHPKFAPLHDLFTADRLAIVHATGLSISSHSHFDAMDFMERAEPNGHSFYNGWIGRHIAATAAGGDSPLRALAISQILPTAMRGSVPAIAMASIGDFSLYGDSSGEPERYRTLLEALYDGSAFLDVQARQTLTTTDLVVGLDPATYVPSNGAVYDPDSWFAEELKQVAMLIKADLGVEAACLDFGGWDTHDGQGGAGGEQANLISELALAVEAFYTDLGSTMNRVTIVTMSEFGRRVEENASFGTDHGYGSCMMVMGGGINGGQVYGTWPGLAPEDLVEAGDLAVTTDYRNVLAEIVQKRLLDTNLSEVFPGLGTPSFLGIAQQA